MNPLLGGPESEAETDLAAVETVAKAKAQAKARAEEADGAGGRLPLEAEAAAADLYRVRILANVELLRSLLVGWPVDKMVERAPRLLTCSHVTLTARLVALTTELPKTLDVGQLVARCPAVLLMKTAKVVARFAALSEALPALDENDVGCVACSNATLMTTSDTTLAAKAAKLSHLAPELLDPERYSPVSMARFLAAGAARHDRLEYLTTLDGRAARVWPSSRALTATDPEWNAAFPGYRAWWDERSFWSLR